MTGTPDSGQPIEPTTVELSGERTDRGATPPPPPPPSAPPGPRPPGRSRSCRRPAAAHRLRPVRPPHRRLRHPAGRRGCPSPTTGGTSAEAAVE